MKLTLAALFLVISSSVFADSYMKCTLTGQTDNRSSSPAPIKVRLDEFSGKRELREDGKLVKGITVKEVGSVVLVSYSALKRGNIVRSSYTFDYSTCEDDNKGSASLISKVEGSQGMFKNNNAVSIYDCICGID